MNVEMLYTYVDQNRLKLFYLKKSLLGQYEATFFEKKHEVDLLSNGRVKNIDVLASAIKEGLENVTPQNNDKEVYLILPQESFKFFKTDVPKDINPSAIDGFVKDKAQATLAGATDNHYYSYFVKDAGDQKQVNFFAVDQETLDEYNQSLQLLGLKLVSVLPESLAIFKLFEKTLRKEKMENILYLSYDDDVVSGYQYDTGGLVSDTKWIRSLKKDESLEDAVKEKRKEIEEKGIKLNRIILSGAKSEKIRQDTFTKAVGVWTNPLKRIIPNFYQDYLKTLIVASDKTFPLLVYDVCFGAYVFSSENKDFQILKKPLKGKGSRSFSMPKIPIFRKEVFILLGSALASFFIVYLIFGGGLPKVSLSSLIPQKATPTPTKAPATPTPAPKVAKEDLKIKVLNGGGVAGKASEVQEILQEAGYQEILTDNADSFDYERTVIQVKKEVAGAAAMLKEDLADYTANPKLETLDEDETSDVIIIVGSDFK